MQLLTHFVSFDILEYLLLKQVDDCEYLSIFLNNEKLDNFSKGKDFLFFADKFPMRMVSVNKWTVVLDLFFLCMFLQTKGENCFWGRSSVTAMYQYRH